MKKILIAGMFPLEGSSSGEYVLDLAYWLHKQDYAIDVFTLANPKTTIHNNIRNGLNFKEKYGEINITDMLFPIAGLKDFPAFAPHNLQGFKIYFKDMKNADFKNYIETLKLNLQENLELSNPDLIICNHIAPLSGLISEIFEETDIPKVPVIQIAHEHALELLVDKKGKVAGPDSFKDKNVYNRLFVDLLEKGKELVEMTLAVSEGALAKLKIAGFPLDKIERRFKGYDPEIFTPNKEEMTTWDLVKLTERGIFQDKNDLLLTACCSEYRNFFGYDYLGGLHNIFTKAHVFVFAGRIAPNAEGKDSKGVDRIIEAAIQLKKKNDDFGIIICGNGRNHSKMISKAYSSGLDNVFFVGEQDHTTVIPQWNNYAVAGIYPSRDEPFGMVAIECIACGTPVITSDVDGFTEFIETIGGEKISDFSRKSKKLAKAMEDVMLKDWKGDRKEKFKKCTKYSWAKIAKDLDKKHIRPLLG